jgi:hypothetical protein
MGINMRTKKQIIKVLLKKHKELTKNFDEYKKDLKNAKSAEYAAYSSAYESVYRDIITTEVTIWTTRMIAKHSQ